MTLQRDLRNHLAQLFPLKKSLFTLCSVLGDRAGKKLGSFVSPSHVRFIALSCFPENSDDLATTPSMLCVHLLIFLNSFCRFHHCFPLPLRFLYPKAFVCLTGWPTFCLIPTCFTFVKKKIKADLEVEFIPSWGHFL